MKIAIAGPGRSGTTLLVKLFDAWGLQVNNKQFFVDAEAGMESKLSLLSKFEVDKDPWAFEYIENLDDETIHAYDAFIIPIRNIQDAATSRSVQERLARLKKYPGDEWKWNSWGTVPGGAISPSSADSISVTLQEGLWRLLESLTARKIQPILLNFPLFAYDFDYTWSQIGHLLNGRIEKDEAKEKWGKIVDIDLVRVDNDSNSSTSRVPAAELEAMVKVLQRNLSHQKLEIEDLQARLKFKILDRYRVVLRKLRKKFSN